MKKIIYPSELPISVRIPEIRELWSRNQVLIVCGATGSGKTTQLPKAALELAAAAEAPGLIGCTQPRRLAATAMANRLARELGVTCGREVGYQVRFDDRTSRAETRIKFMTDGILLAETRGDPKLKRYSFLIIDEAHERSLNIDFILGYLKNLLPRRPDLKVAISSATLDAGRFSEFFDGAPVVEVEGRQYPIEDLYLEPEADEELADLVGRGVRFLDEYDRSGDILVFLPGEREIRDACDLLNGWKLPRTEVMPLFGRLSLREQERVFVKGRHRRIVLATNVAETSITIPGIDYVIDSGLVRLSRYNPRTQVQELRVEMVSRAAARQRRGRCGRVGEGVCLHLYSEDQLNRAAEYTDCEIRRTALAGVILQMALLHLGRIEHFPFIDPPNPAGVREGRRTLLDIGAVTDAGSLTEAGRHIARLPLDPHLAKMLLTGLNARLAPELLVLTAFLSLQDPRERPLDAQQQADEKHRQWRDERSDFLGVLKLWNFLFADRPSGGQLRRKCRANFLSYLRVREWGRLVEDLRDALKELGLQVPSLDEGSFDPEKIPYDLLHQALLSGIPRHVGCYDTEDRIYDGTGGRKFQIFPGSFLFKRKKPPAWLMTFALVETTRLYARQNAEIRPDFIEKVAPHLCTATYIGAHFEPESGFVYARERLTFGGLLIHGGRRVHYAKHHPVEARNIFIREALAAGLIASDHPAVRRYREFLGRLQRLEIKLRRPGTVVDLDALYRHFDTLLPAEVVSQKSLEKWLDQARPEGWLPEQAQVMQAQYRPIDFDAYPDRLRFAGHAFRLEYRFDPDSELDGVTLLATAEELPLIPRGEPDFLVPGWLPEKIEILLRHLPKHQRSRCLPLSETIQAATAWFRESDAGRAAGLAAALADFLTQWTGENFNWRDFSDVRMPEYLVMKIAEIDAAGHIAAVHREIPHHRESGSRLSRLISGVSGHVTESGDEWPTGDFPEEVRLADGSASYPALACDGEGVSRQLFLDPDEARFRHSEGVTRLFRLKEKNLVKFLRRGIRPSNELKLGILRGDREQRWPDDLLDRAIRLTLGDAWAIRDAQTFAARQLHAKENLAVTLDAQLDRLEQLQKVLAEKITPPCSKLEKRSPEAHRQVEAQLAHYFRPGFLCDDPAFDRLERYLRAVSLRLDRAVHDPGKDLAKAAPLEKELERRRLALAAGADPVRHPGFGRYSLLVEEAVIAAFAPEIRPLEKAGTANLEAAWQKAKF